MGNGEIRVYTLGQTHKHIEFNVTTYTPTWNNIWLNKPGTRWGTKHATLPLFPPFNIFQSCKTNKKPFFSFFLPGIMYSWKSFVISLQGFCSYKHKLWQPQLFCSGLISVWIHYLLNRWPINIKWSHENKLVPRTDKTLHSHIYNISLYTRGDTHAQIYMHMLHC